MIMALSGVCQSTVFNLVQDGLKLADKKFAQANYWEAIDLYRSSLSKNPDDSQTQLKLAECYYRIKDYEKSVSVYNSYLDKKGNMLPAKDLYCLAEAHAVLKNYAEAIRSYKQGLEREPDNQVIAQKIWRLNNIHYLYEDSAHYSVRSMAINTAFGELCPVPFQNQLVFVSNRKESKLFENVNGMNAPFYQLYIAPWKNDTTIQAGVIIGEPKGFARTLKSKFNTGPVAFYDGGKRMVLVSTSEKTNADGGRRLGLFFAFWGGHGWKFDPPYPYNSEEYSIHDVTISEDGTKIYFSSDMKGGMGGKDIYSSAWINNQWSKPINIGEPVNTSEDEVFPNIQRDILYFSSDGHAGMGALDIFKVQVKKEGYGEVENVGYPLNSNYDDFGLKFDSVGTHGYFTSNRMHGGYDDDIYEFDIDMQTYPFIISGTMEYKEHEWSNQSEIKVWPNTKLFLVDRERGFRVNETITDENGNFSVTVPYFSKYFIEIVDQSGNDYKVSLEIQKYRVENNIHQIVVVKDVFHPSSGLK